MRKDRVREAVATLIRSGLSASEWQSVKRRVDDKLLNLDDGEDEELPGKKPRLGLRVTLTKNNPEDSACNCPGSCDLHEETSKNENPWKTVPSHESAKKAYTKATGNGKGWNTLALLGKFYAHYRKWCLAKYPGSARAHHAQLDALVEEHGPELVYEGIQALFESRELAWVSRKDLDFLTNTSHFARFIAPAVAKSRTATGGEKTEWEQDSDDDDEEVVVRRKR